MPKTDADRPDAAAQAAFDADYYHTRIEGRARTTGASR